MGSWLLSTNSLLVKSAMARIWARYTAIIWPMTITAMEKNQMNLALVIPISIR